MKKLLLFSVALCATLLAAAAERPPEVVRTGKAEAVNVSVKRRYIGALSSEYDVAIVPRVSGVIEKQNFKDGDFVKKGDLLYLIEDTTYKAAADTAKANVDAAKAKLAQCKAEYTFAFSNLKRVKDMHAKKATSDSNLDEATRMEGTAKAALAAAEAALTAAIAAKRDADNNLSYTRIYSPVDGRAGKSVYSAHNYVTPATGVLLTIVSLDPIFVDFSISAKDFYRMFGNFDNMVKNAVITVTTADGTPYHETGT
ncbi:MAG: efflux RND transporter periplasmic adaptor subunit, partial [Lentisphaeria bacterium]|nr:efflux RND transporter periplasmic adaptor subunit [Lentisphaeria bacterium]